MKIVAQILSMNAISGISNKTGKPYSFHTMNVLDTEAKEHDLIKIMVDDKQVSEISKHVGKIGPISVNFARGNFSLIGVAA